MASTKSYNRINCHPFFASSILNYHLNIELSHKCSFFLDYSFDCRKCASRVRCCAGESAGTGVLACVCSWSAAAPALVLACAALTYNWPTDDPGSMAAGRVSASMRGTPFATSCRWIVSSSVNTRFPHCPKGNSGLASTDSSPAVQPVKLSAMQSSSPSTRVPINTRGSE